MLQRSVEGGLFVRTVFRSAGRDIVVAELAVMVDTAGVREDQLVEAAYGFYKSIEVAHALIVIFAETAVRIVDPRETGNSTARSGIAGHIVIAFIVHAGMTPG